MIHPDYQRLVEATDETAQLWRDKPHQLSPATAGEMLKITRDEAYRLGQIAARTEILNSQEELPPEKPTESPNTEEPIQESDQALTTATQGENQ